MKHKFFLLTMLLALVSITANAGYSFRVANDDGVTIYYKITSEEDKTVEVANRYSGSSETYYNENSYPVSEVIIPSSVTYNGVNYSVTGIGHHAFYYCSSLTSVDIPASITSIGNSVFYDCRSLTSIDIPSGVTSIGNSAFYNCKSLASIVIPDNVTTLGSDAFGYCDNLVRIICKSRNVTSIPCSVSYNTQALGRIVYVPNSNVSIDNGTKVVYPSQLFTTDGFTYMITDVSARTCDVISYDGDATELTVPSTILYNGRIELKVENVGQSTFSHNHKLQSVTLNNQAGIYSYSFYNCTELTELNIGATVTTIYYHMLDGTNSLKSVSVSADNNNCCDLDGVLCSKDGAQLWIAPRGITAYTIPSSVTRIAKYAFRECNSLASIEVPSNVSSIEAYAFADCTNLSSATIDSQGSIGDYAFAYDTNLETVVIGDDVKAINQYAFYGATSLADLTIGNSVATIGNNAFQNATSLTDLHIPHSTMSIGASAFSGCSSLETLYLGEHLKTIGSQAFLNCTKLISITSTNLTPPTCGSEALSGIDGTLCEVNVREEAFDAYAAADGWKDFWFLQGFTINYIEKQPTSSDLTVVMHNPNEEVTYQWYNGESRLVGTGSYPWEEQADGSWKSTNQGQHSTQSSMQIENLSAKKGDVLTFDYTVSSESGYDKLYVYWNGSAIVNGVSGSVSNTYSGTFNGDVTGTLEFRYTKDGGGNSGSDCATVSNIKLNGMSLQNEPIDGATDATLDVTTLDAGIKKVYCIVTLSDGIQLKSDVVDVVIAATGIELSEDELTLRLGATTTATLAVNVQPGNCTDKTVTWASSDTNVATVHDGVVTAVAEGTATITATTANGLTATCNVTIEAANRIEKQPTTDDLSVEMLYDDEEVTYQWYGCFDGSPVELGWPSYISTIGSGLTPDTSVSYPWESLGGGSWRSTNQNQDNTTSSLKIDNVYVNPGDRLSFDYYVSSESGYDKFSVLWNGYTLVSEVSGEVSDSFSYTFISSGSGSLEFRYQKDGSASNGNDCVTVDNLYMNGSVFVSSDTYNSWTQLADGSWQSANQGLHNTTATMTFNNVSVKAGDELTFDYQVSSESNCDRLYVYWNGNYILSGISGEASDAVTYTFTSDETGTLEFSYSKDGSVDNGSDCATISNIMVGGKQDIAIEGATQAVLDVEVPEDVTEVYCVVTLENGTRLTSDTVAFEGLATGIGATDASETPQNVYNLNGQAVRGVKRGVYITNGKKIVVK